MDVERWRRTRARFRRCWRRSAAVGRTGVVSRREDGEDEGESARAFGVGLEVTVREVWARYARESGVLDVAEDARGRGGDAGEEKTSTEKTSLAREMTKRLPMVMSLGIVYVACARRREAVLPVDLSRMAAEGTLPYLSACEIIKEKCGRDVVELLPRDDIFQPHDWQRRLPTPERIVAAAAYAAGKIRAQLPPINASALLTRFVGEFNLDARGRRRSTRVVALSVPGASVRVKTRRGDAGIDVVRLLGGDVEISVRFRREDDDDKATPEPRVPTEEE